MSGGERRRYPRIRKAMKVMVKERQGSTRLLTADVSRKGAFVVTDSPWPERELVHLCFQLAEDEDPVELMGMVTRRVGPGEQESRPGMGIDFFALSTDARKRWDSFVLALGDEDGLDEDQLTPTRRAHSRHFSRFLVRLRDKQRLREFYTRDISAGGMFLRTPTPQQVNPQVQLILVHPLSLEEFALTGEVVRVVDGPELAERGVGIHFDPLPLEQEASLLTFIETGVNHLRKLEGEPHERLGMIMRAVEAMHDSVEALIHLGDLLLREVEPESARQAFRQVLELNPSSLPAHRGLYKVYTMLDDPLQATRHLAALRRLGGQG